MTKVLGSGAFRNCGQLGFSDRAIENFVNSLAARRQKKWIIHQPDYQNNQRTLHSWRRVVLHWQVN